MARLKEHLKLSLSARRAWIEIFKLQRSIDTISVALRKESVDRNAHEKALQCVETPVSLSARRAWIEIMGRIWSILTALVALRKESVDRNFYYADKDADWVRSLSARRAWIEIVDYIIDYVNDASRSPQGERG